jgi:hypothetical protein
VTRTVAEHLVDTLAQAGVKRVYGVVGDSLNPVSDAIRRSGKINWVGVRHEEAGAFAAGAEAQLTGQWAVRSGIPSSEIGLNTSKRRTPTSSSASAARGSSTNKAKGKTNRKFPEGSRWQLEGALRHRIMRVAGRPMVRE